MRRSILLSCLAVLSLISFGCGDKGGTTTQTSLGDNWKLAENKSAGVSVEVPSDWQTIDFSDPQAKQAIDALMAANPDMAAGRAQFDMAVTSGMMKLLLRSAEGAGIQVIAIPGAGADPKAIADQMEQGMRAVAPSGTFTRATITIPAGQAEQIDGTIPMKIPGAGTKNMAQRTYAIAKDGTLYALSCSVDSAKQAEMAPVFERVAKSFKIK